jgi:tellurite resistance protein TehA-like permease
VETVCPLQYTDVRHLPSGRFFFSVLSPDAAKPNAFIYLAYVGAVLLGAGLVTLGIGLLKGKNDA